MNMVDWDVALRTATRLVKPGPAISPDGAAAAVADLRACAARAQDYVASTTGLHAPSDGSPVVVVDRPRWIAANVDGFRQILAPLADKAGEKLADQNATVLALGSRMTGLEVGALMSYLAPRVLGQYDPYVPGGRLLLVAPNIVAVERELGLAPHDFRLWVCLHEETHRVQFTAVPWLRQHLLDLIGELVGSAELDSAALAQLVRHGVTRVREALAAGEEISVVDLVQTPDQRETVDRITAVMSLLEGHADVIMDRVGPEVIPSIVEIRRRFEVRRAGQGTDKIIRKLIGLDAKLRQYRDGAAFCRAVLDRVGMDGLNAVWTSAETLPSRIELGEPEAWLARVHPATQPA